MISDEQLSALVALLRSGGRAWAAYVTAARELGDAAAPDAELLLERRLGLLAYEAQANAAGEIGRWRDRGYRIVPIGDPDYPVNLRVVPGAPPLLFVAGEPSAADAGAVAVIGTRHPSQRGVALARELSQALGAVGHTVVSGLAAGIDREAHTAALACGRRTVAVIGTGLDHAYPAQHAPLQAQIAARGAVVSQFWPEAGANTRTFPARNRVMAGLTLASVIVQAGPFSGTRTQARHALAAGRRVILMEPVMDQTWASELSAEPGVEVAASAADALALLRR